MYMRPLLGLTACKLNEACLADQIAYTPTHSSRSDSTAAALLWMRYRDAFIDRRIFTFRDLTLMGRRYKFFSSFGCNTWRPCSRTPRRQAVLKPRR
jgi:DNA polymerase-3 subunit epsilon